MPAHWPSVPYGRPLRNQRYRVVDAQGRDRPDWVPGELWIGGLGVATGYRGDPEATGRSFVTVAGTRWYRTGDLGRYWPDGTLEFLGRTDHQVKIRGHRIELGEVEAALLAHPAVAAAVVLAVGEPTRLAATIVPRPEAAADGAEEGWPSASEEGLLAFLRERLPAHSVPASVTSVTELPLTSNGKVDRRALAARVEDAWAPVPAEPPRRGIEETVAGIWAELLGTPAVSRWDNFFSLGGDSLLATRMISKLHAAGFADAELGRLFHTAELASFAADLRHGGPQRPMPTLRPDPEHRHDPFPPTDVQRAYWVGRTDTFALGGVGCHFYTEYDAPGSTWTGSPTPGTGSSSGTRCSGRSSCPAASNGFSPACRGSRSRSSRSGPATPRRCSRGSGTRCRTRSSTPAAGRCSTSGRCATATGPGWR